MKIPPAALGGLVLQGYTCGSLIAAGVMTTLPVVIGTVFSAVVGGLTAGAMKG